MRESIVGLLEKADLAVAAASGVVDERHTVPVASAARALRRRLDYPEDLLIVAFAGGTGSGKSSLVNAIVGFEVSQAGGARPTTDRPLAVASDSSLRSISGYLSGLGITATTTARMPDWLCLVDLPDSDSVEVDHRAQVDALLPRIDVVVWVVDPEKYRNAALHDEFLQPLSGHSSQFIFVMNQIDRVRPGDRPVLISDFEKALVEDGLASPLVLATAASPPAGPPRGVEELSAALKKRRSVGVAARVVIDLGDAAVSLLDSIGESGLDFEERSRAVTIAASTSLVRGDRAGAIDLLTGLFEELASEAGGTTGARIREVSATVPPHVQRVFEDIEGVATEDRRGRSGRSHGGNGAALEARAIALLDEALISPARDVLRQRSAAIALTVDLSLSVAAIRSSMGV